MWNSPCSFPYDGFCLLLPSFVDRRFYICLFLERTMVRRVGNFGPVKKMKLEGKWLISVGVPGFCFTLRLSFKRIELNDMGIIIPWWINNAEELVGNDKVWAWSVDFYFLSCRLFLLKQHWRTFNLFKL